MNKWLAFLTLCVSCGCSSGTFGANLANQTIDYQVADNRYAVVVVEDGISSKQAHTYALQRAAQVAKDEGYNYFTVDKEDEVAMARSAKQPSSASMPRNLYYEMIQSDNFGREPVEPGNPPSASMVPGHRVEFSCYKEKPPGKSFRVTDLLKN